MDAPARIDRSPDTFERLLILIAFAPLLLGAADEIQEVDPSRLAEAARRLLASPDRPGLRDAFGPLTGAPPGGVWLISGALGVLGASSLAVRLPALLLGVVLLWATARIGARLFDRQTGLLGAALLGASVGFQLMAADPKADMAATAFGACAVLGFLEARERPARAWLGWLCAGLAVLSKGPLALVAPALALLPEVVRLPRARLGQLKPFTGPLLLLAVLAPWLLELVRDGAAGGPGLGALLHRGAGNGTTPLFFLHTGLWAFLPFAPLLGLEAVRGARAWRAAGWALPADERRVLVWWLALGLVAISASADRLPQQLYALAPPAALLSARVLTAGLEERTTRLLTGVQLAIATAVLGLIGGVLLFVFPTSLPWTFFWGVATAAVLAAGHIGAGAYQLDAEPRLALLCVLSLTTFNLFFEGYLHRELLEFQPDRELASAARRADPAGTVLPFFHRDPTNAAAFYARRDVAGVDLAELTRRVRQGEASVAVIDPAAQPELEAGGFAVEPLLALPGFTTQRPTLGFLLSNSRPDVTATWALVRLSLRAAGAPP